MPPTNAQRSDPPKEETIPTRVRRHRRRGRRPISQRAHARGVDVKPAHGRDTRTERTREHEGRALARGKKPARQTPRKGAKPTSARERRARNARLRARYP